MKNRIQAMDQLYGMGLIYNNKDYAQFMILGDSQMLGVVREMLNVDDRCEGTEDDNQWDPEGSEETWY